MSLADSSRISSAGPHGARPGAFGLHLPALAAAANLLVSAPERWPDWHIELASGSGSPRGAVDDQEATLACEPSGWVQIDRRTATSRLHLPSRPSLPEVVQPRLATTAIVVAHWRGHHSFHAGAFIVGGLAWGILGSREAGKSSMLAALSRIGAPVLADDLLVLDDRLLALAGPRCLDLREQTADALGQGESIGVVGTRERWRVELQQVESEVMLGGFVQLDWGASEISLVAPAERVQALASSFALRLQERSDEDELRSLIDVFAMPMLRLRRPRRFDALAGAAESLLEAVELSCSRSQPY